MNVPSTQPAHRVIDYSQKWLVLFAVATSFILETIDSSIVNVALPTLVRELHADFASAQWVVLINLLAQTSLMLMMGRLGDMLGKRSLFISGMAVFTTGTFLCGLAPNIQLLITFRVLQAIGSAMMIALAMGIVTEAFPPTERGKAMGMISFIVSIGIILGPIIGGLVLEILPWHWIFFVNVPIGLVGLLLALRFMPDFKPRPGQTFDFLGALTFFVFLLTLLLALTFGQRLGFTHARILTLFGTSVTFLVFFILAEQRIPQPMIDLHLFHNPLFSLNLITRLISFVAFGGVALLLPFYLRNLLELDQTQVGLLLTIVPFFFGITAPISGIIADRFGPPWVALAGLVTMLIGCLTFSTLTAQTSILGYILRMIPFGMGLGIFQSPNNSEVMGAVPRERLGVASGINVIARTLGRTSGIAALGAFWASRVLVYAGSPLPEGPTTASVAAQIAGLRDMGLATAVLVGLAIGLTVWSIVRNYRPLERSVIEV